MPIGPRLLRACAVWLVLAVAGLGCGGTGDRGDAGGPVPRTASAPKRATAAIIGAPLALSQKINAGGAGSVPGVDVLEELVSAGLAGVTDTGELYAQLAEAVPTVENGHWRLLPDGRMETSWVIKDAARWHDGTPVSADDLVFTLQVGQDPQIAVFREIAYDAIADVEADGRTVTVKWRRPFIQADALFSRLLALPLPKHLLEKPYLEDRATFIQVPHWTEAFVGTGPYRMREWVPGTHAVLGASDTYVLGRPQLDEIMVKFILDPNTVVANVLAGSVDVTLGRGISLELAIEVRGQWRDGRAEPGPLQSWLVMFPQFLDPTPAALVDVRFRRALLHGLDREHMAEALQYGLVPVAHSYVNPNLPEYGALAGSIVQYDFDPRRAGQLIEELGYQRGADGIFRDGVSGQPLALELRTIDDRGIQEKSLFTIGDYWQRIGIALDPVLIPRQRQPDRPYRATFPGLEMVRQGSDLDQPTRAHSAQTPLLENNFTGNNRTRYRSPALDALLDRYVTTVPPPERLEVAKQIVHHMTDQVVWMGIFFDSEPMFISNRLSNVAPSKARPGSPAWNAHTWDAR